MGQDLISSYPETGNWKYRRRTTSTYFEWPRYDPRWTAHVQQSCGKKYPYHLSPKQWMMVSEVGGGGEWYVGPTWLDWIREASDLDIWCLPDIFVSAGVTFVIWLKNLIEWFGFMREERAVVIIRCRIPSTSMISSTTTNHEQFGGCQGKELSAAGSDANRRKIVW